MRAKRNKNPQDVMQKENDPCISQKKLPHKKRRGNATGSSGTDTNQRLKRKASVSSVSPVEFAEADADMQDKHSVGP
jgi:hypothetical protein